jgi:hypothetical protein
MTKPYGHRTYIDPGRLVSLREGYRSVLMRGHRQIWRPVKVVIRDEAIPALILRTEPVSRLRRSGFDQG